MEARSICAFLRNESHRLHISVQLSGVVPYIAKRMSSFTASFFKLRFETLYDVFVHLLARKDILLLMTKRMFINSQDPKAVDEFLHACSSDLLWAFVDTVHHLAVARLEKARRWGIVCDCCQALRWAGKTPQRPRASRRLHQAMAFIEELKQSFRDGIRSLTLAQCVDDFDMMTWVTFSLRVSGGRLKR